MIISINITTKAVIAGAVAAVTVHQIFKRNPLTFNVYVGKPKEAVSADALATALKKKMEDADPHA